MQKLRVSECVAFNNKSVSPYLLYLRDGEQCLGSMNDDLNYVVA